MHAGSLIAGLVIGAVLGVGGAAALTTFLDGKPERFEEESLENTLQLALGPERARVVRCHQSDGPFWVCRALTQPDTGNLYNITVATNGRCFTGVEAETAMKIDEQLSRTVRGWLSTRADCRRVPLPGASSAELSADPFVGALAGSPKPTAYPLPPSESSDDSADCDPNYAGACLDPGSYDYDCEGGSGDGPDYTGTVEVVGTDVHGLDRDGDGTACD